MRSGRPSRNREVFELTDEMALPDPPPPAFQKIDPQDDLEFTETAAAETAAAAAGVRTAAI